MDQALSESESVVIFADLVTPHSSMLKAVQGRIVYFNLKEVSLILPERNEGDRPLILVPRHSERNPVKTYLGPVWERFLLGFESEKLILITPPMRSPLGFMPESYLASLYSIKISVVS